MCVTFYKFFLGLYFKKVKKERNFKQCTIEYCIGIIFVRRSLNCK